ncbi:N-formylglutamate amidohydrolase [Mesorhizobium sp. RP14(2022)]|uniref:N-formylglutamate amidohydrolase n=1 Tax=Mesorhizobium liriopis TaxID=2953882 RepID=A0ABT1C2A0_9HYPH|nr:N-formylglutamate amidohydrolase [Mesorhizobium liriopis]MCO6048763.1 N-formylglutamate amidohydrolase [Mesorhizobium liriopis]
MSALASCVDPLEWPAPVEVLNAGSLSPVVLICDHASNHIPASYELLGLPASHFERHIAYDIGAAAVTRSLAGLLNAPAFLGTYSRLLVDLNRPFGSSTSMPTLSESTEIPGNRALGERETTLRRKAVFEPFHAAVSDFLDSRTTPSLILAIHSFTPVFLGVLRPWHVGILHEGMPDVAHAFISALTHEPGLVVGENVPYRIERDSDFAVPVHGTDRGNPAALIEIRNDLIADDAGAAAWADRLAAIVPEVTAVLLPASGWTTKKGNPDVRQ